MDQLPRGEEETLHWDGRKRNGHRQQRRRIRVGDAYLYRRATCYLRDYGRLDTIDAKAFQTQKPFPFVNPEKLLSDQGYRRLLDSLPDGRQLLIR